MKENPIKTGIIFGIVVAVVTIAILAIIIASHGAAAPPIIAAAGSFGAMMTATAAGAGTSVVVGAVVAAAIITIGCTIVGAISGVLARSGIARSRAKSLKDSPQDSPRTSDRKSSAHVSVTPRSSDNANNKTKGISQSGIFARFGCCGKPTKDKQNRRKFGSK